MGSASDTVRPGTDPMRAYEYRHTVGFEETNLVGNVYYVNHLRWQGRAREMFLRDHCPELLEELGKDLVLVTLRCSCEYLSELEAFDEVLVRMRLQELVQNRISLGFDFLRIDGGEERPVARGEQEVACMRREAGGGMTPCPVPEPLREALRKYR